MGYVSLDELKHELAITDDDSDVSLQRALDSAAKAIDNLCGRAFTLDATDQTKYFYPYFENQLDVVDLVTVTSIKTDTNGDRSYSTTLATTDYELLPYNEPRAQQVKIWPLSSRSFGSGRLAQIVGKFGYVEGGALGATTGTTPYPVRQANLILATRFYTRKDAPFGILNAADVGAFARLAKEDPDVVALVGPGTPYNRHQSWVVA